MHCHAPAKNSFFSARTGVEARHIIRAGGWAGHTSGVAPNFVQANIVILPEKLANDFLRFCQPCFIILKSIFSGINLDKKNRVCYPAGDS